MRYVELIESHDMDLDRLTNSIAHLSLPKVTIIPGGLHSAKYLQPMLSGLREVAWDLERVFKFYVALAQYDGVKVVPSSGEFTKGVKEFLSTVEEMLSNVLSKVTEDENSQRNEAGTELIKKLDLFNQIIVKVMGEIKNEVKNNKAAAKYHAALTKLYHNLNTMRKLLQDMAFHVEKYFQGA
jgi:hypothetical protein